MKREQALRRQLGLLHMLGDAIEAVKSLSAHHLRLARRALEPARTYRSGIDDVLAAVGISQAAQPSLVPAVLLLAADLGLCDGYGQRLVASALARPQVAVGPFYCVGHRPLPALRRAGVDPARCYDTPTSVDGLARLLLSLADDVLGDYLEGRFGMLVVVSARFEGVGAFTPTATQVLPIASSKPSAPLVAAPYISSGSLVRAAGREYLYCTLFELLLDALASEHGTRLVATQSAGSWLDEEMSGLQRQLAAVRQEASTQEVLDVASGARMRKHAR
ncbi:MAG: F0F1 ATP synthase subunit gamma [Acidobacteriota bacterium]|nr:F0F1 ATP synthase subunit gamma [Acidobacteriota bacterium]